MEVVPHMSPISLYKNGVKWTCFSHPFDVFCAVCVRDRFSMPTCRAGDVNMHSTHTQVHYAILNTYLAWLGAGALVRVARRVRSLRSRKFFALSKLTKHK